MMSKKIKIASYDIVFQEIPNEITLALNISNCPNNCPGCHSPHLREDIGEILDFPLVDMLIERYGEAITSICFMGGDLYPLEINRLAGYIKKHPLKALKTGWYSGNNNIHPESDINNFDYIKLGPYIEELGGLKSRETNQRLYRVENGEMMDITHLLYN